MRASIPRLWLVLMVTLLAFQGPLSGVMQTGEASVLSAPIPTATATPSSTPRSTPTATATPSSTLTSTPTVSDTIGVDVGTGGGTVDLPDGGDLTIPQGALQSSSRFSRYTVQMSQAGDLRRYHPLGEAVRIEARRSDNGAGVATLQKPATIKLKLSRPLREGVQAPAVRVQKATGWDLVSSSYDQSSKIVTVTLTELPVTLALVDDSEAPGTGDWDPADPAAVQLAGGSWGVAYTDAANPPHLFYRRSLESEGVSYWTDAVTVDTGPVNSDTPVPAIIRSGSTLALFYRKSVSGVKQVFLRTSTDDGISWSSATQLTTETVSVYQVQASITGGTVHLFYSLSDTSGTLQYRTASTSDLSTWAARASVGQTIGPLQSNTYPNFDIKKVGSGNVVATYKYDAFGGVLSSTGAASTEYRFTGQQEDPSLGYYYVRGRYYDPATGRFISKDHSPGSATAPASLNPYTYARNSPTNLADSGTSLPPLEERSVDRPAFSL